MDPQNQCKLMHYLKLHKLFAKNTIFASAIQNARTTGFEISVFRIQTIRKKKFERVTLVYFCFYIMWNVFYLLLRFIFWLTLDTSEIFDNKEVHLLPLCTFWTKIFIYLCCWDAVFINKKKNSSRFTLFKSHCVNALFSQNNFLLHTLNDLMIIDWPFDDWEKKENLYLEWIALHCSCQI